MKYNEKYGRWVTKGGLVYRYSKAQDKLVLCKLTQDKDGYFFIGVQKPKVTKVKVHRLVFETFVSEIPQGYEIDHINTIRDDNKLENLRLCTPKENHNNPLTLRHMSESLKGNNNAKNKPKSEFGNKFLEHYGITRCENERLYMREHKWYDKHNKKCRWEK